jgi:hypothetical protein
VIDIVANRVAGFPSPRVGEGGTPGGRNGFPAANSEKRYHEFKTNNLTEV